MLAIARAIIDQRTGKFDPSEFRDRYQEALRELIDAKMKGLPSAGSNQEKLGGKAMTEKTVRAHSVLRRTMLVGTAGVLGGAVLHPTPVGSQTSAPPAVAVPGSSPPGVRYGDPAWWAQRKEE